MIFMVSYRTSMQIVGDLLTATEQSGQEGIKTTALISKANLPHSRLSKFPIKYPMASLVDSFRLEIFSLNDSWSYYLRICQCLTKVFDVN